MTGTLASMFPVSAGNSDLAPEILKKDDQPLLIEVQRVRKIAMLPHVINEIKKTVLRSHRRVLARR